MRRATQTTRYAVAILAGGFLLSVGCGGNGLPMTPVSGKVTFDGGPPPAAGRITFTPSEITDDLPRRPGLGRFGTDGEFVVTSFREGDGLVPGTYEVKVSCLSGLPDVTKRDATAALSYVAPGFQPEPVIVTRGRAVEVAFDVPRNPAVN